MLTANPALLDHACDLVQREDTRARALFKLWLTLGLDEAKARECAEASLIPGPGGVDDPWALQTLDQAAHLLIEHDCLDDLPSLYPPAPEPPPRQYAPLKIDRFLKDPDFQPAPDRGVSVAPTRDATAVPTGEAVTSTTSTPGAEPVPAAAPTASDSFAQDTTPSESSEPKPSRAGGWSAVPEAIWRDNRLSPEAVVLWGLLNAHSNNATKVAYVSQATLARWCGLKTGGRDRVRGRLRRLSLAPGSLRLFGMQHPVATGPSDRFQPHIAAFQVPGRQDSDPEVAV
jgi:hypothetical protein